MGHWGNRPADRSPQCVSVLTNTTRTLPRIEVKNQIEMDDTRCFKQDGGQKEGKVKC